MAYRCSIIPGQRFNYTRDQKKMWFRWSLGLKIACDQAIATLQVNFIFMNFPLIVWFFIPFQAFGSSERLKQTGSTRHLMELSARKASTSRRLESRDWRLSHSHLLVLPRNFASYSVDDNWKFIFKINIYASLTKPWDEDAHCIIS